MGPAACPWWGPWAAFCVSIAIGVVFLLVLVSAVHLIASLQSKTQTATASAQPAEPNDDSRGTAIIGSAIDYVKVTTGLSVAALGFAVAFLGPAAVANCSERSCLVAAVFLLAGSAGSGLISQSALVGMLSNRTYDVMAPEYSIPGTIHVVAFLSAIAAVGISILFGNSQVTVDHLNASTPSNATSDARHVFAQSRYARTYRINRMTAIELIKGVDSNDARAMSWHVQFEILPRAGKGTPALRYWDALVDAASGSVSVQTTR